MRKRQSIIVVGVGLVLAVSGGIGFATSSDPSSSTPSAAVPRVVPDSGQDLEASIAALQSTLRRIPQDHVSWANLAVAYVEQARITGNASFYEKADDAAARSFEVEPDENFTALAAQAAIESYHTVFWWSCSFFVLCALVSVVLFRTGPLDVDPDAPKAMAH